MNLTATLLCDLWSRFGDRRFPSEWDGVTDKNHGGKLSQRYWEYFKAIELLELTENSVVLDIGGGSPVTGLGFFSETIAPHVKAVHVLDTNFKDVSIFPKNVTCHRGLADYKSLLSLLKSEPGITHIASVSVFEHIPQEIRVGITRAINEGFLGEVFVATFEFHAARCYMDHQLTTTTLSEMSIELKQYFPDAIERSPIHSQDAHVRVIDIRSILGQLGIAFNNKKNVQVPLWYPVAVRFRKNVNS